MMANHEWPLVFFTLFGQAAVGLIFALALLSAGKHKVLRLIYSKINRGVTIFAILAMVAAVLFSFLHLGSPVRAVYALSNLSSSWLSREIFMVIVFSGMLVVRFVFLLIFKDKESLNKIILWLCVFAGAAMVYSMARLYMIRVVPPWDSAATLVLFFSGSLILGIPLFLSLLLAGNVVYPDKHGTTGFFRMMVSIVFLAFLVRIPFEIFAVIPIGTVGFPPSEISGFVAALHYLLLTAGTGLLLAWGFIRLDIGETALKYIVLAAFLCLLLGEVAVKYIFYTGYYRIGV